MKEIIWIAGASAVGKKTFIDKLLQEELLRERFKIWGTVYEIDCKVGNFEATKKKIANSSADYILIKWQHKDNTGVEALENEYPKVRHRMFILWCSRDQHFRRYDNKHKHELTRSEKIKWFNDDRRVNHELLQDFCSKTIEVEIIDSGQAGYPTLENIPSD